MQELHNNLLKYFKFSPSVHVGILWEKTGSHRIFQIVFMKSAKK